MAHIFPATASVVACVVLALPAFAAAQDNPGLSGVWSVTVISPEAQHPASLVVIEQDGQVTGVMGGPAGQVPVDGTRTAEAVSLRFSVDYEGAPLPITLTARPGADALSGEATFGTDAQGTWKASRVTPTGITGAWTFWAAHEGGPIPGALTLLEENGKVSGRLLVRSRGVDGVVSGTNGDGALALKVDATVDGSPVEIDMPGRVDGASALSGRFAVGDITGRWSATRP